MKSYLIAGNWKSNKTRSEAKDWLREFKIQQSTRINTDSSTVILCAPYTLLCFLNDEIRKRSFSLMLGAQDVSPYDNGAYTGAVNAKQIKEFAEWVIIGHSERRKFFGESDTVLFQKVEQAKVAGLRIIYCVSDEHTAIPDVDVVAYEPVWAIGTGKADTPENANTVIAAIKRKTQIQTVIYGGSVKLDNAASYLFQPDIDGVLLGGASLDAHAFAALLELIH
ncbi:triosephosphate isomerase [Candidatus Gottesmanbacteria bacterium]|nr:triosephosphate isomerase [Candidatus Gottesmanbacteria bacterium]